MAQRAERAQSRLRESSRQEADGVDVFSSAEGASDLAMMADALAGAADEPPLSRANLADLALPPGMRRESRPPRRAPPWRCSSRIGRILEDDDAAADTRARLGCASVARLSRLTTPPV